MLVYKFDDDTCQVRVFNNIGIQIHTPAAFLITYKGMHTADRGHFHCNDRDTAVKMGHLLATLHA